MKDILILGALAIFVLAFILNKLSNGNKSPDNKAIFGGHVDDYKASKKAVLWSIIIAIGSSIFLFDGKFTHHSRYGAESQ